MKTFSSHSSTKRIDLADERGGILAAVSLIGAALALLAAGLTANAIHTSESTGLGRVRATADQAADAGIAAAFARLENDPTCMSVATSPQELRVNSRLIATYRYRIDEAAPGCTTQQRIINAWGYSPGQDTTTSRQLQVSVSIIPQEGFPFSFMASGITGSLSLKNNGSTDGDAYAESLNQTNNNLSARNVVSSGTIVTKNNGVFTGTLWAAGNVTASSNTQIGGSIIASGTNGAGNVVISNGVSVGQDIRAKGSISLPTTYSVGGIIGPNLATVPAPPSLQRPDFAYDPIDYSPAPIVFATALQASLWLNTNRNNLAGTVYVSTPVGRVDFTNGGTVTADFNLISAGPIDIGGTLTNSGPRRTVIVVSQFSGDDAIVSSKAFTGSPGLDLLFYTNGDFDVKNATTFTGAIYADQIDVKNNLDVARSEVLYATAPAGFNFSEASATKFSVIPIVWRSISPVVSP